MLLRPILATVVIVAVGAWVFAPTSHAAETNARANVRATKLPAGADAKLNSIRNVRTKAGRTKKGTSGGTGSPMFGSSSAGKF